MTSVASGSTSHTVKPEAQATDHQVHVPSPLQPATSAPPALSGTMQPVINPGRKPVQYKLLGDDAGPVHVTHRGFEKLDWADEFGAYAKKHIQESPNDRNVLYDETEMWNDRMRLGYSTDSDGLLISRYIPGNQNDEFISGTKEVFFQLHAYYPGNTPN